MATAHVLSVFSIAVHVREHRMRKLVARNLSYRIVAAVCFALGAVWYFWFIQKEPKSQIRVQILPPPPKQTLLDVRQITSGYAFGGHIHTCGAYRRELGEPDEVLASRLREKACMLESEVARRFILKNWKEKQMSYLEIDYPCPDCRSVNDVLIEQNNTGDWIITIRREPDRWDRSDPKEVVAVGLKRRRATDLDEENHVVGESLLVFVDADGDEIATL